nr:MAG TPA: hypothetical protein [Bacteriophage sp.]
MLLIDLLRMIKVIILLMELVTLVILDLVMAQLNYM